MENESDRKGCIAERKEMFEKGDLARELVKNLLDERTMNAIQAFKSSPAMESIVALQDTPAMKAILAFQNSPAMRAIRALQSIPMMQLGQLIAGAKPIHDYFQQLGDYADSKSSLRQAAKALESAQASPLAEFFASEGSSDISNLVEAAGSATISIAVSGDFRVATAAELELERQIVGHLEQGKPASALSTEQRSRLVLFLGVLMLIMALIEKESAVRQELCFFQPKMAPFMTSGQVGKAVRNYMCEKEVPEEFLKRYRTVKGNGVRLRSGPSMKAEVLPVNLEDRAPLEVLDSEDRRWLHVAVVGEDGVDGWISRKHTHQLVR